MWDVSMIAGVDSPDRLSWKVKGGLRKKEKQVKESLKGWFDAFHRMIVESLYLQYQFLTAQMATFETRRANTGHLMRVRLGRKATD